MFYSVAKSCGTLWSLGLQPTSVLHYLLEFIQIHVQQTPQCFGNEQWIDFLCDGIWDPLSTSPFPNNPFFPIHLDIRIFEPSRDPHNFNAWSKSTHSEQVHSSVFYYLHLLKQPSSIFLRTSILWQSLALFTLEFLKDVRIYQTQHFSSLPNGQVGTDELFHVSLFAVLFFFGFALKTLLCKNKHPNLVKCFSLFTGCSCSQGLAHSVEVSSFSLSF